MSLSPKRLRSARAYSEARLRGASVILIYWRPSASQRRRLHSPEHDDARLDHSPGHQWRRHNSRLGICLSWTFDRERRGKCRHRNFRSVGRNRAQHSSGFLAGGLQGRGYGRCTGTIHFRGWNDVCPPPEELEKASRPSSRAIRWRPLKPICLRPFAPIGLLPGRQEVRHPWKHASIIAQAFVSAYPLTVHPGIGYDIISNHPDVQWRGDWPGRREDFRLFGGAVERLDGGVVLSIGSAIMAPQVFEKSLSCVNNLRLQDGRRHCSVTASTSSICRTAGIGTGRKANRRKPIRPTTSASAKVSRGWAERCAICNAITPRSSTTSITNCDGKPRVNHEPHRIVPSRCGQGGRAALDRFMAERESAPPLNVFSFPDRAAFDCRAFGELGSRASLGSGSWNLEFSQRP